MLKVFVHFQDSEVVGVSGNSRSALQFILDGENRTVKEYEIQRGNHKSKNRNIVEEAIEFNRREKKKRGRPKGSKNGQHKKKK